MAATRPRPSPTLYQSSIHYDFESSLLSLCGFLLGCDLFLYFGQMDAYSIALRSQANCIEVDVSRSSDGVLFALHDRYLSKVFLFHLSLNQLINFLLVIEIK